MSAPDGQILGGHQARRRNRIDAGRIAAEAGWL